MEKGITVKIGDYVEFPYRDNPSLQLIGYVEKILLNTIIVDISEIIQANAYENIDMRQVVKHGCYRKMRYGIS
ncbi:DUF2187 domain-containing protein [Bacillus sp. BP-3]|uniref:DUF2187 domain-containing protein n=1 Tax=Bacillus sp. BP-3 TaxID=3022773 RepID=UPI00232F1831|nr:DUF2187 domain-containing protein [Bacillus sp. BP-3]MDC2867927.1 DUF2187 domain-containing protein [Bacillus sp. BP-3]